mmetsp:Transcript_101992/g.287933  ORF Transcript_101992/g.287933 Transcript_101992/m.287933 type:complete len:797 (+) Transcript_101992:85-2475(+)
MAKEGRRKPKIAAQVSAGAASDAEAEEDEALDGKTREGPRPPLVRQNAHFEAYYRRQGICTTAEWTQFLSTLQKDLPMTVRVNSVASIAGLLVAQLQRLQAASPGSTNAPRQLRWYPQNLAWQWDGFSSEDIKRDKQHSKLKACLLWLQNQGALLRQEAVSMIPPLCLDVKPSHWVLDMCAAPGSKTSQIVEMLHAGGAEGQDDGTPQGAVVANEVAARRADTLAHNLQRLGSPCSIVTQIDAQFFPAIARSCDDAEQALRFDRVLADVPCSGDGTFRKNPEMWRSWTPQCALGLHIRQLTILCRGLANLKVGGRLVYSTCSFNPIEDEAVVAAALSRFRGDVTLVPLPQLDGLHGNPGLSTWFVPHPDDPDVSWERFEDVPPELKTQGIQPSMFPPESGIAGAVTWEQVCSHCRRFLPHVVAGGGFFVAALERTRDASALPSAGGKKQPTAGQHLADAAAAEAPAAEMPPLSHDCGSGGSGSIAGGACVDIGSKADDSKDGLEYSAQAHDVAPESKPKRPPRQKRLQQIGEYELVPPEDWQRAAGFLGLDRSFAARLVRKKAHSKHQKFFCMSEGASALLLQARARSNVRVIHAGVRVLEMMAPSREHGRPGYRIAHEGLPMLLGAGGLRRRIAVSRQVMIQLLTDGAVELEYLYTAAERNEVRGLGALVQMPQQEANCQGPSNAAQSTQGAALGSAAEEDETDTTISPVEQQSAEGEQKPNKALPVRVQLASGGLAVTLLREACDDVNAPSVAVAALLSKTDVQLHVPKAEVKGILESLDLRERTEELMAARSQ